MIIVQTNTKTVKEFAQTILDMCDGRVSIGRVEGPHDLYWTGSGNIQIGPRQDCGCCGGKTTGLWAESRYSHIAGLNLGYWWGQNLSEQQREIIQELGNALIHEDYEVAFIGRDLHYRVKGGRWRLARVDDDCIILPMYGDGVDVWTAG